MNVMRYALKITLVIAGLLAAPHALAQVEIRVDTRIELFGIISRLADYEEYNKRTFPSFRYDDAIDKHFAKHRQHDAIKIARSLRKTHDIGWNAPIGLAITLEDSPSLKERVNLAVAQPDFDPRWEAAATRKFLRAVRRFRKDAQFDAFVKTQRVFYQAIEERMRTYVKTKVDLPWFQRFYGFKADDRFVVVPGMISFASFGGGLRLPSGQREVYAVASIGKLDEHGIPVFEGDGLSNVVIHEFNHSFVNPYTQRHAPAFTKAAAQFHASSKDDMESISYGMPSIVLDETIVRAASCRYAFRQKGESGAEGCLQNQQYQYFHWTPQVYALLERYENARDKYPTFEHFTSEFAPGLSALAAESAEIRAKYLATGPRVASVNPASGTNEVDPEATEIKIEFSEPMQTTIHQPWASIFPFVRSTTFDDTGKILTLQVRLEPNHDYDLKLNSLTEGNTYLRNLGGRYLAPSTIHWRTRGPAAK